MKAEYDLSAGKRGAVLSSKGKTIKRYTFDELQYMQSQTDHKRLDAMTDDDIAAAARSDPDNPPLADEQLSKMRPMADVLPSLAETMRKRGRPPKEQPKEQVTIRLDAKVLEYFKQGGEGWQTRLNQVLSDYVDNDDKAA